MSELHNISLEIDVIFTQAPLRFFVSLSSKSLNKG